VSKWKSKDILLASEAVQQTC